MEAAGARHSVALALRRVVLPQVFRMALPVGDQRLHRAAKDSSLVSVITVVELTKRMTIVAVDNRSYVSRACLRGPLLRDELPSRSRAPARGEARGPVNRSR